MPRASSIRLNEVDRVGTRNAPTIDYFGRDGLVVLLLGLFETLGKLLETISAQVFLTLSDASLLVLLHLGSKFVGRLAEDRDMRGIGHPLAKEISPLLVRPLLQNIILLQVLQICKRRSIPLTEKVNPEGIGHTTSLVPETNVLGIEETASLEVHDLRTAELNSLHLGIDNSSIVAFTINVPDFGHNTLICDGGQDDMLEVDGKDLSETIPTSGFESVRGVIRGGPGVGVRVGSRRQLVEQTLVLVALGTHEDKMLKGVRST
ncbi:hypothetical protein HG531_006633 [Fusarium graminearum]|nr:hypothetical protein HG531_006633 [Fusarium graminearum]